MPLTGLPAFFVDVPMFVRALVGFSVLLTVLVADDPTLPHAGPR